MEPVRFDEMRPGCFDPDARVADMDIGRHLGVGQLPVARSPGFCGAVYSACSDPELGLACVRACNDWFFEEWFEPVPGPLRPAGHHLPGRPGVGGGRDPPQRRARVRGGVACPSSPTGWGTRRCTPAGGTRCSQACVDTGTVVCLHVGSARGSMDTAARRPAGRVGGHAVLVAVAHACADWLWSGVAAALSRPAHRHERGRHRLGADAGRPPRLHPRRSGPRSPGLAVDRAHADRGAAAQLLVLLARRPVDLADPRPHRRRPHHGRGRLPARRLDVARHPGVPGRTPGRAVRRRARGSPTRTRPRCSAIPFRTGVPT